MKTKTSLKSSLVVVLSMAFAFILSVPQAFALTISPARVELATDPGTDIGGVFTIINEQKTEKTFYVSFENFESQGETGTPLFTKSKTGLASWLATDISSVTLEAGESKDIRYNISVPKDAQPGGYFSAIFLSNQPPTSDKELTIGAKVGMLVLLGVNGDVVVKGGVSDFQTKDNKFFYNSLPVDFSYRFNNEGADRIKPIGFIHIRNLGFIPSKNLNANSAEGNILPHSIRKFQERWIRNAEVLPLLEEHKFFKTAQYQWKNFAFGFYTANLDLSYGKDVKVENEHTSFIVFPWQLLILIITGLSVLFIILRTIARRYNRYVIEQAEELMEEREERREEEHHHVRHPHKKV